MYGERIHNIEVGVKWSTNNSLNNLNIEKFTAICNIRLKIFSILTISIGKSYHQKYDYDYTIKLPLTLPQMTTFCKLSMIRFH